MGQRTRCSSEKQPLHLDFKNGSRNSIMFKEASDEIVDILSTQPVTSNFHKYCVTEEDLINSRIADKWNVISTNKDKKWFGIYFSHRT